MDINSINLILDKLNIKAESVFKMENSYSSQVFIATSGEKKYVVKILTNIVKGEKEFKYLKYLRQNGINTPIAYDGFILNENSYCILMSYVEGVVYDDDKKIKITKDEILNSGILLAKLHSVKMNGEDDWKQRIVDWTNNHMKYLRNSNLEHCGMVYKYILNYLNTLSYEPVILHLDYRLGNIIFGEEATIIDFESVRIGDPVFDFVKLYRIFDNEEFETFKKGYCKIKSLPENFEKKLHYYNLYDSFTTLGYCMMLNRKDDEYYKRINRSYNEEIKSL